MGSTKIIADVAVGDEPISVADAKKHARIDDVAGVGYMDALVQTYIIAARRFAEHYCNRSFAKRTLAYALDAFPCETFVKVETGPIAALTSIAYRDSTDTAQTFNVSNVFVDDTGNGDRIYLVPGQNWPVAGTRARNVRFQYDTPSDCPETVKDAMLLLIKHIYENPAACVTGTIIGEVPFGVTAMLDTAKVWEDAL